jgi:transcriptional regulator with XRE-family HTH domain
MRLGNAKCEVTGGDNINSLLKQVRLSAGLSIEEAARRLDIPAGYLSQIENGQRQVKAERAEQIAQFYGKDKEYIFLASRYVVRKIDSALSCVTE